MQQHAYFFIFVFVVSAQRWDTRNDCSSVECQANPEKVVYPEKFRAVKNENDWKTTLLCDAQNPLDKALYNIALTKFAPVDPGNMRQMTSGARYSCVNDDISNFKNAYEADGGVTNGVIRGTFREWGGLCGLWYMLKTSASMGSSKKNLAVVPLRFVEHGQVCLHYFF